MFYATFSGIGESDIAEFRTEWERDDWVNFRDKHSLSVGYTKEAAVFGRKKLSKDTARRKIRYRPSEEDWCRPGVMWYIYNPEAQRHHCGRGE